MREVVGWMCLGALYVIALAAGAVVAWFGIFVDRAAAIGAGFTVGTLVVVLLFGAIWGLA